MRVENSRAGIRNENRIRRLDEALRAYEYPRIFSFAYCRNVIIRHDCAEVNQINDVFKRLKDYHEHRLAKFAMFVSFLPFG